MSKWIAITVIGVLGVGVIATGILLWQQTGALGDARSDIADLEGNVATLEGTKATLEGNVATLEGNVSTLETQLSESEATVSGLETDLDAADAENSRLSSDLSTQRNINSALSSELNKVKSPRLFQSTQELADWLYEDDTDTRYASETGTVMSYILMIRALRDGFLLPVDVDYVGDTPYVSNAAIIGDSFYWIYSWDDDFVWVDWIVPIPSGALSLD